MDAGVPVDSLLGLVCMLFVGCVVLAGLALWIWMLVDCLSNEPSEGNDKLVWMLVIVLLSWLGALIYYFVRRPVRIQTFGK